jgi:hypothetical protein
MKKLVRNGVAGAKFDDTRVWLAKKRKLPLLERTGDGPPDLDSAQKAMGWVLQGSSTARAAPSGSTTNVSVDWFRLGTMETQAYRRETARDLRIAES